MRRVVGGWAGERFITCSFAWWWWWWWWCRGGEGEGGNSLVSKAWPSQFTLVTINVLQILFAGVNKVHIDTMLSNIVLSGHAILAFSGLKSYRGPAIWNCALCGLFIKQWPSLLENQWFIFSNALKKRSKYLSLKTGNAKELLSWHLLR